MPPESLQPDATDQTVVASMAAFRLLDGQMPTEIMGFREQGLFFRGIVTFPIDILFILLIVLREYIGRTLLEVRGRLRFLVREEPG